MGWHIECLENTLDFNEACVADLNAWAETNGHDPLVYQGYLLWGDLEHACWFMYEQEVIDIFVKHGTRGEVLWGSVDGDNAGSFWGWRFEEGRCVKLKGVLTWEEDHTDEEVAAIRAELWEDACDSTWCVCIGPRDGEHVCVLDGSMPNMYGWTSARALDFAATVLHNAGYRRGMTVAEANARLQESRRE